MGDKQYTHHIITPRYLVRLRGGRLIGLYALVEPFVWRKLSGTTIMVVGLARPRSRSTTAKQSRKNPRRFFCNEKKNKNQSPCVFLITWHWFHSRRNSRKNLVEGKRNIINRLHQNCMTFQTHHSLKYVRYMIHSKKNYSYYMAEI